MKLMFASDIHGSLPATERVLSLFAQSGAQWLIILGDVLNHGPRNALPEGYAPAQVAEKLKRVCLAHYRRSRQLRQRSGPDAAAFSPHRAVAAGAAGTQPTVPDAWPSFWPG